ncbi:hypothetical protein [Shewanella violacea]|uniref:Uncharacterized protein n=1 Tax=Shewanella violacea (strain JCM 10179 / CIP 106290 / LMG 19151 / DSS12) TaxID=637905 RepID=D4ZFT1_SHEVD|nr:hypothetical protein [Shewanella violacea]BAJ00530.1 hypothetical protein SVI_0559 [Shewanella violacea DSS12]
MANSKYSCTRIYPALIGLLLAGSVTASEVSDSSDTRLQDTQEAIETFQNSTKALLDNAHQLNDQHAVQMQQLTDVLQQTESAKAVLQSNLIGDIEHNSTKMLVLANQYVSHYRTFINSIRHESTCYQPKQVGEFEQTIAELEEYVGSIQQLAATQDSTEAFAALMEININQARVSMVVNLFEMFKLCYLTEAIGPLGQEFEALSKVLEQEAAKLGYVQDTDAREQADTSELTDANSHPKITAKYRDNIVQIYQFKADAVPHFNELTYLYIDNIAQLKGLTFSNGLSVNDDLSLKLPASAQANINQNYQAKINGTIETDAEIVTLDITVERAATSLIGDIQFIDKQVKNCVNQAAQLNKMTYSHQLTQLNCTFIQAGIIRFDDLTQFKQLNMLSVKGGALDSLAPLASLSSLNTLYLSQLAVNQFDGVSQFTGSLNFSNVSSSDWAKLALSNADSININQLDNCQSLQPLTNASNVAVMYKGLDANELMAAMGQIDNGTKSVMVMTNCTKIQVNSL